MTEREAFAIWFSNVGKYYNSDIHELQECFYDACNWQRERDAAIAAFERDTMKAQDEYEYSIGADVVYDAILNQGEKE